MRRGEVQRAARHGLAAVSVFVLYVATAHVGLSFFSIAGVATPVWAPTGIAIAALTLGGRRLWPAIAAAAFVVNTTTGLPLAAAAMVAAGNTLEAILGAWMLGALHFHRELGRLRDVLVLLLVALGSTTVSATVGLGASVVGGLHPKEGFGALWTVWWVGDVMGDLLVAPAIFVWSAGRPRFSRRPLRWLEAGLMAAILTLTTEVIFRRYPQLQAFRIVRGTYVLFPPLIWVTLRFEQRGTTAALLLVAALAVPATAAGTGLFSDATPADRLLMVQFYMAVTVTSMLTLGAALAERRAAIRARDEFISIASHELRTPLTALRLRIASAIRLIKEPRAAADDDAGTARLGRTLEACERISNRLVILIDDLLDVSRLTARRLVLHLEPIAVGELLDEVVGRLRDQASEVGSTIVLDGPAAAVARWDRSRIEQVLTNLLSNAIKYGDGKPICVDAVAEHGRLRLRVKDEGHGIAPADQERIFHAFERVQTTNRVGGLGLGLYIGRQIAVAHGGALTVESASKDPKKGTAAGTTTGTTFTLDLPLEVSDSAPPVAPLTSTSSSEF